MPPRNKKKGRKAKPVAKGEAANNGGNQSRQPTPHPVAHLRGRNVTVGFIRSSACIQGLETKCLHGARLALERLPLQTNKYITEFEKVLYKVLHSSDNRLGDRNSIQVNFKVLWAQIMKLMPPTLQPDCQDSDGCEIVATCLICFGTAHICGAKSNHLLIAGLVAQTVIFVEAMSRQEIYWETLSEK